MFKVNLRSMAVVGVCLLGVGASQTSALPSADAAAVVRAAVENELRDAQDRTALFRYTLNKQTTSGTSIREMVETKDGIVARTVLWNGRELTPEEREKEDRRLKRLIESPEEQRKKFKEQREDQTRVLRIVKALPSALLYYFDGQEVMNGRETMRLRFTPNPEYSPESRELYILKSAEGHLWIDIAEQRIARLSGTLARDVGIGWGILGHLNRGGTFLIEQQAVAPKRWRLTMLNLDV
jgi:hypothetical protein